MFLTELNYSIPSELIKTLGQETLIRLFVAYIKRIKSCADHFV